MLVSICIVHCFISWLVSVLCTNVLVDRCLQMWQFLLHGLVGFLNDCWLDLKSIGIIGWWLG